MTKKILFRADGNVTTGLGHLYRLFALVEMCKREYDFVFLTKESSVLSVIPSDYTLKIIPEEIDINQEPIWIDNLFSCKEYIMISDGYQFSTSYQKKIKEVGFKLMYIDDLVKEHMFADIVVNHSPHAQENHFTKEPYTKFALGTKYALLRPSFLNKNKRIPSSKLDSAFVCFGGADEYNFTHKCVMELLDIPSIEKINIIIGEAYSFSEIYEVEKKNSKVKIYKNIDERSLYNLMKMCNFGIAPTSTILFELISVNMYLVSGFYVENQRKAYHELERRNVFKGIGDFNTYQFNFLKNYILNLSPTIIQKQIESQKTLIDGNQKRRFLTLLNELN